MEQQIIKVIEKIRPYLQRDGGDIEFVRFDVATGVVYVNMLGACVGCHGLYDTLKMGIEILIMEEVEGVTAVELAEESMG